MQKDFCNSIGGETDIAIYRQVSFCPMPEVGL